MGITVPKRVALYALGIDANLKALR